jgi:hypothetical protein
MLHGAESGRAPALRTPPSADVTLSKEGKGRRSKSARGYRAVLALEQVVIV